METLLAALAVLLLGAVLAVLYLQFRRPESGSELAVLAERLAHLRDLPQTVGGVQLELRGLAERVSAVEKSQQALDSGLQTVTTSLAQTGTSTSNLVETAAAIQSELSGAKERLTALQAQINARQEMEQRTAESIRRLETIIAGTQTKGAAGENILEAVFAQLPPEWQLRDFRVGNKVVEFGLRLPNGLVLPIDSKWPATGLLEQFAASADPSEQQKLKKQIEDIVLNKAREVKKYLDPSLTADFAVLAVPDAVYGLCAGIQAAAFRENVVIVGHSMFLPYLLLVFQTILKSAQDIDLERLRTSLETFREGISALQNELDTRFSKALAMLNNSQNEMRTYLSKLDRQLAALQVLPDMTAPAEEGF
ncbi:MAG TPA: DNA recombination protein RmuC [Desulfotomaculum sp.]|nr:DNA recombination protein RmuC [Desulfotomaculum sp.]